MGFMHIVLWAIVIMAIKTQVCEMIADLKKMKEQKVKLSQCESFMQEYGQYISPADAERLTRKIDRLHYMLD